MWRAVISSVLCHTVINGSSDHGRVSDSIAAGSDIALPTISFTAVADRSSDRTACRQSASS